MLIRLDLLGFPQITTIEFPINNNEVQTLESECFFRVGCIGETNTCMIIADALSDISK